MNILRLNKLRVISGTGPGGIARARFEDLIDSNLRIQPLMFPKSPHHHPVARSPIFQNDRGEYMVTFGSFAVKLIFVVNFSSFRKWQSKSKTDSAMGMPLISTIVAEGRAKPNWCRSSHLFASQRLPPQLQLIQPLVVFISSPQEAYNNLMRQSPAWQGNLRSCNAVSIRASTLRSNSYRSLHKPGSGKFW
jgi:hypothetical protein